MYIRTFEKKQTKMRAGKKTIEEKQTILLGSMQRRKYFMMWDVQSHSITRRSGNDLESRCL